MRKAYGYIRCSTLGQAQEGVTLSMQREKIAAWCNANDCELVQVFEDVCSGAKTENRPGFVAAVNSVCKAHGVLVVYSLSRATRSTKDLITLSERLEKAKAGFASVSEAIDTVSASGRMVFRMLGVLNEFEREQLSERTRCALAHKKQRRERISGLAPFGFSFASDGVTVIPNEKEQHIVRTVFDMHEAGLSLRGISAELKRLGVCNRAGRAVWHPSVVRLILVNNQKKAA